MDPTKGISEEARRRMESGVYYVAGIDSGSTSTDVVILDQDGKIKSTMIIPVSYTHLDVYKRQRVQREGKGCSDH